MLATSSRMDVHTVHVTVHETVKNVAEASAIGWPPPVLECSLPTKVSEPLGGGERCSVGGVIWVGRVARRAGQYQK